MSMQAGGDKSGFQSEINVTPMVEIMLVLLIIFMVSAPLLTVGVPLDLPQTQAKSLEQDKTPLQLSVDIGGKIFINDTEVSMAELVPKLKAITEARGGMEERIYMRADKKAEFGPKFGVGTPLYKHHTTSLVFNDPPLHTRVRKLLAAAFTPRALANLQPRIEAVVDGLLSRPPLRVQSGVHHQPTRPE